MKTGIDVTIHPILALDETLAGGRGMTDCEKVGIMGGCGVSCPVLQAGQCEYQKEMLEDNNGN